MAENKPEVIWVAQAGDLPAETPTEDLPLREALGLPPKPLVAPPPSAPEVLSAPEIGVPEIPAELARQIKEWQKAAEPSALPTAVLSALGQSRRVFGKQFLFSVIGLALVACTPAAARPIEPPPEISPTTTPLPPITPETRPSVVPPSPTPEAIGPIPFPMENPDATVKGIVTKASEAAKALPDFTFRRWVPLQLDEEQWYGVFLAQARDSGTQKLVDGYYLVKPDGNLQFLNQKLTPVTSETDYWSWQASSKPKTLIELRDQPGTVFAEVAETGEVSWQDLGFAGGNFTFTDPTRGEQSLPQGYPLVVRVEKDQTGKPTKIEMKSGNTWLEVKSTLKLSPQALEHARVVDMTRLDIDHIPEWVVAQTRGGAPIWTYEQLGNSGSSEKAAQSRLQPDDQTRYFWFDAKDVMIDPQKHIMTILQRDGNGRFIIPYDHQNVLFRIFESSGKIGIPKDSTEQEIVNTSGKMEFRILIPTTGIFKGKPIMMFLRYSSV